jgi:antitoxin FitA
MASHEKMKMATEPFHPLCLTPVPACHLATQPPSSSDRTVISLISAVKDFPAQEEHDVAQLIVRNVDPEVVHRLKLRAAQHGRSMEAEHREILRQALLTSEPGVTLKALLLAMPPVGDDTDFARLPDQGREVEL